MAGVREDWLRSLLGKPLAVLAEGDGTGHAENFARVTLPADAERGEVLTLTPTTLAEGVLR